MPDQAIVLEHANAQREQAKRATLEALLSKRRAEKEVKVVLAEGEPAVTFKFVAIKPKDYDELVTKHQPTAEQAKSGANINPDTFPPALVARVCAEPKFSEAEWRQVWDSEGWGRGELNSLYWEANELCNRGLEITPFESG